MNDRFWIAFGKTMAVACTVYTFACACGFVALLYADYQDSQTKAYATIAPDSSRLHKGKK